jgi:two-component system, chemotaxis family, chemotaxis protein CheY
MKKVLIIEDDAPLCWLMERMLRGKYHVIVMNNGLEAWSWLSEGNHCDLIISDINMPSLNGVELLENLRNSGLYNTIQVIIVSGLEEYGAKCMELGAFSYFLKPFEPRKFLTEVTNALNSKLEKVI